MRQIVSLGLGILIGAGLLYGYQQVSAAHHSPDQPYAGQDKRAITSLSSDDIRQLEAGEGWGLAKPAELNGYPGPAHVLEFAEKLELTADQREQIETAFANMNAKARELGSALVKAEAALDQAFRSGTASADQLRARLAEAEAVRALLRETHLSAHLEITPLLTEQQKRQYASLRGYNGSGHNAHSGH